MLKLMFWRNFEMMSYYSFLAIYLNELINHTCFCITASGTKCSPSVEARKGIIVCAMSGAYS